MSDLDNKLAMILEDATEYAVNPSRYATPMKTGESTFIDKIKAVFADAGYVKVEEDIEVKDNVIRLKDLHLMTGAEWYKKFQAELPLIVEGQTPSGAEMYLACNEAAKRAAGIKDEA